MEKNFLKKEGRTWVQERVKNMLKGEIGESVMSKIKIKFDYDDEDGFWASDICVRQWLNGKWEIIDYFYFYSYYGNYWEWVVQPWVCDMVGDITNEVMKFIHQPKKKEF